MNPFDTATPEGYYDNPRPELLAELPRDGKRILELGCGSGAFARSVLTVRPAGAEYWGIEPDPRAAERARVTLTHVFASTVEGALAELPNGYFDLVVCNDVLEHLVDPERVMRELATKLTPDATWFASVPNVRFLPVMVDLLVRKEWRYCDAGVLDRTHLRFFTEKSLRRFVEECGFRLERMRGINSRANAVFQVFNLLTLGFFRDTQYPQFVIVAKRGRA